MYIDITEAMRLLSNKKNKEKRDVYTEREIIYEHNREQ